MVLIAQKQQQNMGMDNPTLAPEHKVVHLLWTLTCPPTPPPHPCKRLDRLMLLIPVTQWFRRGHPPPPPPPHVVGQKTISVRAHGR